MNPRPVPCVRRGMLTFQLGKHLIHALAFSPDGSRLAVANGHKVTLVDWQAPGKPVWHEPPRDTPGSPIWLTFRPDGPGILIGYNSYGRGCVLELDPAAGSLVACAPHDNIWRRPTVVAGSDPPAVLAAIDLSRTADLLACFVVPLRGGLPLARLGVPASYNDIDWPKAAWADSRGRLGVWSDRLLQWFRWPPPPAEPGPSRWRALASAVGVARPVPPELELLAKYPFPPAADAVAPLPDGDTLLVARKGALVRWHAPTGTELARWRWPKMHGLRSIAVSPDGTVAAVGGKDGWVVVWDLDV